MDNTLHLSFPMPCPAWNSNGRLHWAQANRYKRAWRDTATLIARQVAAREGRLLGVGRTFRLNPCEVQVELIFPVARRRDPHNYTGTVVKAVVDGMVRAEYWPDDTPEWVRVMDPWITVRKGAQPTCIIHLQPMKGSPR
jgi:Holliday junction resolvase RusA-like endonuclease